MRTIKPQLGKFASWEEAWESFLLGHPFVEEPSGVRVSFESLGNNLLLLRYDPDKPPHPIRVQTFIA